MYACIENHHTWDFPSITVNYGNTVARTTPCTLYALYKNEKHWRSKFVWAGRKYTFKRISFCVGSHFYSTWSTLAKCTKKNDSPKDHKVPHDSGYCESNNEEKKSVCHSKVECANFFIFLNSICKLSLLSHSSDKCGNIPWFARKTRNCVACWKCWRFSYLLNWRTECVTRIHNFIRLWNE